jgi:hypothetical protein
MTRRQKEQVLDPFGGLLTEQLDAETIRKLRVDRETELQQCLDCLCKRCNNILLHGKMGVGKTFLVRMLHEQLVTDYPEIFACYLNLIHSSFYGPENTIAIFPTSVLLVMCSTIWRVLFKRDYSELRAVLSEVPGALTSRTDAEARVAGIYRQLMTSQMQLEYQRRNVLGASAILKGEMSDKTTSQWHPTSLLPFEFFDLTEELITKVLHQSGITAVAMICDEATKFSTTEQQELLARYVEMFTARQVRFAVVVRTDAAQGIRTSLSAFEEVPIGNLAYRSDIEELLSRRLASTGLVVSSDAIDILWETFQGNPLGTLGATRICYDNALKAKSKTLDAKLMMTACARALREIQQLGNYI